jgi:hypothetical protein
VQLLLGDTKLESTICFFGIEVIDACKMTARNL